MAKSRGDRLEDRSSTRRELNHRPGDKDRYDNRHRNYRYDDKSRDRSDRGDRRGDRYRPTQGNDNYSRNRPPDGYRVQDRNRDDKGKDKKRVSFERKYQAVESEPEPESDQNRASWPDDEDEAALSDSSTFSARSQQAYATVINGDISERQANPTITCSTYRRSPPSTMVLEEHQLANCCISP